MKPLLLECYCRKFRILYIPQRLPYTPSSFSRWHIRKQSSITALYCSLEVESIKYFTQAYGIWCFEILFRFTRFSNVYCFGNCRLFVVKSRQKGKNRRHFNSIRILPSFRNSCIVKASNENNDETWTFTTNQGVEPTDNDG